MTDANDATGTSLTVELLGSGGYHPSERRHTACVLLPELSLMLDAGTGAFRVHDRLAGIEAPAGRLDVLLTHAHLDHVVGLTYLLGLSDKNGAVETVVHAAPDKIDAVEQHLLTELIFPVPPYRRVEPLAEELPCRPGVAIRTFPLDHPGGSLGIRIDHAGKSLAYVTDTRRPTAETIELIRGVDLLLHEAYFHDADADFAAETGHCTASQAAQTAVACQAGRLVMMHLNPRATEADERIGLSEARTLRADAVYGRDSEVFTL